MSKQFLKSIDDFLQEVEPSCNPEILFAKNLLLAHTEELSFDASTLPRETIKQIDAALNEEGDITIATSSKLSNIRFKLGDFLLETASAVITMTTSIEMPVKFVITALKFLQKIRQLEKITISSRDAQVLLVIHQLKLEQEIPTVDKISNILSGLNELQLISSLETLENLACITISMNEIILNETIVVRKVA